MPVAYPVDLPYRILAEGAERISPDPGQRSEPDSGFARQSQQFSAVVRGFAGSIPFTAAQLVTFEDFYDALSGGTFTYPAHPFTGLPTEARFIVGRVGPARYDGQRLRWMMPVAIEFLA